jgi:hypothetical protein
MPDMDLDNPISSMADRVKPDIAVSLKARFSWYPADVYHGQKTGRKNIYLSG